MADPLIPPAGAPRLPTLATAPAGRAKAEATAREFEAVFVGQMTKLMMESVATGEFGGGHGEEMFRGVLAEQLGGEITKRGGLGIAPAVLGKLFDPFVTTKPAGKGTGLGLAVCQALAERLGGSITAGNRPSGGAVFTVTLPRAR